MENDAKEMRRAGELPNPGHRCHCPEQSLHQLSGQLSAVGSVGTAELLRAIVPFDAETRGLPSSLQVSCKDTVGMHSIYSGVWYTAGVR